jgi:Na+-transporting NADH:ubiquinone oxidoreductase subunit NqrE
MTTFLTTVFLNINFPIDQYDSFFIILPLKRVICNVLWVHSLSFKDKYLLPLKIVLGGRRGLDRMVHVVRFTTTYAISAYHN